MGRGRDKVIHGSDIANMSPSERARLGNLASTGRAKIRGAALVRDKKSGNAKYGEGAKKGTFGEDKYG